MTEGIHQQGGSDVDMASPSKVRTASHLAENRYRRLFETARHGILLLDFHSAHIEDSNPHFAEMLGYAPVELLGKKLWEAPPFRESVFDQAVFAELQRLGNLQLDELRLATKHGSAITVQFTAHVYEHAGHPLIQCHIRHAPTPEERLQALADQLETARHDLESFSHSVAHDLRSPIGQIDGFAYLLGMEYADQLDDKGHGHIQRIRGAAKQMLALIDDLAALNRISRAEIHPRELDLSDMAQALMLDHISARHGVQSIIAPHLTAFADADLMRMVLDNLFRNAMSFTAAREPARIEFGALQRENETIYFVRDNGVGFDCAGETPLFVRLQRMQSIPEFAGAGIRLAKAERALQRQGGKLWAESAVQHGATFYFTLHPLPA